jgi:hypothetical protein
MKPSSVAPVQFPYEALYFYADPVLPHAVL